MFIRGAKVSEVVSQAMKELVSGCKGPGSTGGVGMRWNTLLLFIAIIRVVIIVCLFVVHRHSLCLSLSLLSCACGVYIITCGVIWIVFCLPSNTCMHIVIAVIVWSING